MEDLKIGKITQDAKINEIMDMDFNTPNLITYLLDLVKELNTGIRNNTEITTTYDKINLINNILGLKYNYKHFTEEEKQLYKDWLDARDLKDFAKADVLRQKLVELEIM